MLTRHRFLQLCAGAATAPLARAALAQAIPSGAISVRDFGARGDGISNDSPGINAALQASQAKGDGGTVFLPAGRYVLRGITQARPRPIYTRVEDGIDVTRVAPQVRAHIFLSGLSRLSLVGERGTEKPMPTPPVSISAATMPSHASPTCRRRGRCGPRANTARARDRHTPRRGKDRSPG